MTNPRIEQIRRHWSTALHRVCKGPYEYGDLGGQQPEPARCDTCGQRATTHHVRDLLAAYDRQAQWLAQVPEWDETGECYICGGLLPDGKFDVFRKGHKLDCWFAQKEQP